MEPVNWKIGLLYYCPDDPRVVVRQRFGVGWTWNFGHRMVVPAMALAVLVFLAPPMVAWSLGVRSPLALSLVVAAALGAIMFASSRLSRPPRK